MKTFDETLAERGCGPLVRGPVSTLQINVGRLCNQACQHCHVDAGPKRTEVMTGAVADRLLAPTFSVEDGGGWVERGHHNRPVMLNLFQHPSRHKRRRESGTMDPETSSG